MAHYLGYASVGRMLREMTWREWLGWRAYMEFEPFGEEIENIRAALVAQATWNVEIAKAQGAWDSSKRRRGARPEFRPLWHFILRLGDAPDPKPPVKRLSPEEQFARLVDSFKATGMKPVYFGPSEVVEETKAVEADVKTEDTKA